MNAPALPDLGAWTDHTRVPYGHQRELESIFYGPFWHAVAIEAELPRSR